MVILGAFYKEKVLVGLLRILNKLLYIAVKIGDPYYPLPARPATCSLRQPTASSFRLPVIIMCYEQHKMTRGARGVQHHAAMLSYCLAVILPCCHAVMLSYCHAVMLSCCHVMMSVIQFSHCND